MLWVYLGGMLGMIFLVGVSMSQYEKGERLSFGRTTVLVLLWPLAVVLLIGAAVGSLRK